MRKYSFYKKLYYLQGCVLQCCPEKVAVFMIPVFKLFQAPWWIETEQGPLYSLAHCATLYTARLLHFNFILVFLQ